MNDFDERRRKRRVRNLSDEGVKVSNLENYLAGYNVSGFVSYPEPKQDELLNAHLRGYNLHLIG